MIKKLIRSTIHKFSTLAELESELNEYKEIDVRESTSEFKRKWLDLSTKLLYEYAKSFFNL